MADPIKFDLMTKILDNQTWTLATQVTDAVFLPEDVFVTPKPKPRPALAVPVDVQALYVPRNHSEKYVKLPLELGPTDGGDQTPPFGEATSRPAGVHLHWAMPDGLLRGDMQDDADAAVDLPALPDRWLVTRLVGLNGQNRMTRRDWIIEADAGKIYDIGKFPETPSVETPHPLNADDLDGLAGGSPNWTAAYDASFGRFAFYDPLEDVTPAQVQTKTATYVVIGWWSERKNDPLATVISSFSAGRRIARYGWSASPAPYVADPNRPPVKRYNPLLVSDKTGATSVEITAELKNSVSGIAVQRGFGSYELDEVIVPKRFQYYETAMHGVVYGVPVTGGVSAGNDLAPRARDVGLSLAPSLDRVMAAQASKAEGINDAAGKEYFESLMTSVANGAIMNLEQRDGVVLLDEMEHGSEFDPLQGPDELVDILKDRPDSELRGRKMRSRAAPTTGKATKSDVIWTGFGRGSTNTTKNAMRIALEESVDKRVGRRVLDQIRTRTVRRAGPRYYRAKPPVIGLRNFGKTNRFLGDGRFNEDGTLTCLWTEEISTGFEDSFDGATFVPTLVSRYVPAIANRIVRHHYIVDPYAIRWTVDAVDRVYDDKRATEIKNRLWIEVALRFDDAAIYDGFVPLSRTSDTPVGIAAAARVSEEMRRFSLLAGRDVSPVAVTSWRQPWCPVWLEWEVELEPGQEFDGWTLGRIAFEGGGSLDGGKHVLQGRSAITSGLARTYQGAIDTYLTAEAQRDDAGEGEIGAGHEAALGKLRDFLGRADLGSVTLDQVSDVWLALPMGPNGEVPKDKIELTQTFKDLNLPRLIASGRLRLSKARIVDTFGRFRDIPTDRLNIPAALAVKSSSGAPAMAMAPRLSLPSRLMWRFVDPGDDGPAPAEGSLDQTSASRMINPVAGYILPDFMDESLEFFDQDGTPLGEVLHDPMTGGVAWEGAVGRAGPASASPMDRLPDTARACGRIAQGMLDADLAQRTATDPAIVASESPLSAFLRAVDTTMWSVDSDLASSGATIAGLVGKPVAVVSTQLWLDIPDDLSLTGIYDPDEIPLIQDFLARQQVFEAVKSRAFQVRLGELAKGHDGLYGFYIGNDFSQFHLIDKGVGPVSRGNVSIWNYRTALTPNGRSPALHPPDVLDAPYITGGAPIELHAGQRVRLTLLMQPTARVHATTGILPRKSLELIREWVQPGLEKVAPSARVGPVLIDPDKVRLPKIAGFGEDQTWTRRDTPLTWRDDPILAATQAAVLPSGRVSVEEGYVRITPSTSGTTPGGTG